MTLDLGSVDAALAKCRRVEAACEHTSGCPDLAATLARAHDLLGLPERAGVVETLAIACDQVAMRRGDSYNGSGGQAGTTQRAGSVRANRSTRAASSGG